MKSVAPKAGVPSQPIDEGVLLAVTGSTTLNRPRPSLSPVPHRRTGKIRKRVVLQPCGRPTSGLHAWALPLVAVSLILAGCSTSNPEVRTEPPPTTPFPQPGDAIYVQIWREPDLSGTFDINSRGVAVLPLLGERTVTGMEPDSLRDALVSDYRHYLQNPSIDVRLLRRVNILGMVRSPGLYPVDATISLADALAVAGGIAPTGNPKDIRLIREGEIVRRDLDQTTGIAALEVRSGDQIVVGQKSWFSRNTGALLGAFVAATAVIAAAVITSG